MPESMHERYDADERRLLDSAASELWTDALLNAIVDVAPRIYEGASWAGGSPVDAPPRWAERSTAVLALASMALRTIRTLAMTVRSGYAPEALGDLRRLIEAAGHAQRVAEDTSGQYAENWLHGRGKAGKARAAFGSDREDDPTWRLLSSQSHAEFASYASHSAELDDERRIIHLIGPHRDPFWDSIWLWMAARHFARVLACVLKVRPQVDDADFLAIAARLVAAETRIDAEMAARGEAPPDDPAENAHG